MKKIQRTVIDPWHSANRPPPQTALCRRSAMVPAGFTSRKFESKFSIGAIAIQRDAKGIHA